MAKFGIELDSAFEVGNSLHVLEAHVRRLAQAKGLQGFERGGGGLFERGGVLLTEARDSPSLRRMLEAA